MSRDVYIVHNCKNTKKPEFIYEKDAKGKIISKTNNPEYCNNAWIDEDKYNSMSPPRWKYCQECVDKGYKNPKTRKSNHSPERIEAFKNRMIEYRQSKQILNINSPSL